MSMASTATVAPFGTPEPGLGRVGLTFGLSIALHLALGLALYRSVRHPPAVPPRSRSPVEIHDIPKPFPPPPAPVEPPTKFPSARFARVVPVKALPPQPPAPPPPLETKPPPNPIPPTPVHIGVHLESTVSAGAFAAPIGNSAMGEAPKVAPNPSSVRPYWASRYVAPYQVAELPVLISEVKAPYPPLARKAGIEGQVILLLTIDDGGRVAAVKRIAGPGHGLDEAAVAAAHQFRFKPARYNGTAVATDIRYIYSFEID